MSIIITYVILYYIMVVITGSKTYVSTAVTKETQLSFGIITKKSEDSELLKTLYDKIYNSINLLLSNFVSGDIQHELYTQENISDITQKISNLKTSNNTYYNGIINIILDNLTSIKYGYNYYTEQTRLGNIVQDCNEKMSILYNFEKLKEYLIAMYSEVLLIETSSSLAISAELKPEYIIYINLYGIPPELVFDEKKISEIKYLQNLGVFN